MSAQIKFFSSAAKMFFLPVCFLCAVSAHSQVFLNGDFENNTAGTDQINISNAAYGGFMANSVAFGTFGDIDIVTSGTYCGFRQSGCWYVALTGNGTDAFSMRLSAPLVTGNSYTMSFWDKGLVELQDLIARATALETLLRGFLESFL